MCVHACVLFVCVCANVSACRSKTVMRVNCITSTSLHTENQDTLSQPAHTQCGSAGDTASKRYSCTQTQKHLTSAVADYCLLPYISTTQLLHTGYRALTCTITQLDPVRLCLAACQPAKTGQIKALICLTLSPPGLYTVHAPSHLLYIQVMTERDCKTQWEEDPK